MIHATSIESCARRFELDVLSITYLNVCDLFPIGSNSFELADQLVVFLLKHLDLLQFWVNVIANDGSDCLICIY